MRDGGGARRTRMKRHLLNLAMAFALLLFVAVAGLWGWSYWRCAAARCWYVAETAGGSESRKWSVFSWHGRLHLWHSVSTRTPAAPVGPPPKWNFAAYPEAIHDEQLAREPRRFEVFGLVLA